MYQISVIGNPIIKIDPSLSNKSFNSISLSASTVDALVLDSNIAALNGQ